MKLKLFHIEENLNFECPICGTNKSGTVFLIPRYNELNKIIQGADIVHFNCYLNVCYSKNEFMDIKDFSLYIHKMKNKDNK